MVFFQFAGEQRGDGIETGYWVFFFGCWGGDEGGRGRLNFFDLLLGGGEGKGGSQSRWMI